MQMDSVEDCHLYPCPAKGGCNPLRFFFKNRFFVLFCFVFCPINYAKRFNFFILYVSFDVYEVKSGGVVWVWGHQSKENGRGVVKPHDSYFVHFFKYLTRYVLQTCYVDENHHFRTYSAKNNAKISCFYDFLKQKIDFC